MHKSTLLCKITIQINNISIQNLALQNKYKKLPRFTNQHIKISQAIYNY